VILIDSNVIIDARDQASPFFQWAEELIVAALADDEVALNAIVLAEICVGQNDPKAVETELRAKGLQIIDVPAAASAICSRGYTHYRLARKRSRGGDAPHTPLPDFFIGAHAELMGWQLATRDSERFRVYFPKVKLIEPPDKLLSRG
jgi:predicted nucleic acid-binding protein